MEIENYLVIDLEATCSEDNEVPRNVMEIIEIGAIMVDGASKQPVGEFQSFVRPVRRPRLTDFCRTLTSISQADVDQAAMFPIVMQSLIEWRDSFSQSLFCSWGAYDRGQFQQDCDHHGIAYPFGELHLNLKSEFSKALNCKRMGMGAALKSLGMALEGTHHRAIDDARNIAKLLPRIFG